MARHPVGWQAGCDVIIRDVQQQFVLRLRLRMLLECELAWFFVPFPFLFYFFTAARSFALRDRGL